MINLKTITERSLFKNKGEQLLGISLTGLKNNSVKSKKINNICFAIDISSSMNESTTANRNVFNPNNLFETVPVPLYDTRIELAKKSLVFALNNLNKNDIFSVVVFNENANVLIDSIKVKDGIEKAINTIENLKAYGSTNLHSGWLLSCQEIAKNYKKEYLNRIILISDGETNQGEKNPTVIANDVSKVFKTGISTTTIGVGSSFNEDLLSNMANEGGGNFYYIKSSQDFISTFDKELAGLNNLSAYDVKINLSLNEGISYVDLNVFKKENNFTILPNIMKEKEFIWLTKLNISNKIIKGNNIKIGYIEIEFKNEDGQLNQLTQDILVNVVSEKEWKLSEENSELKMKETLLDIANKKQEAALKMKEGNYAEAKEILKASVMTLGASAYCMSTEFQMASATLNATIEEKNDQVLRKMIVTQSYNERR